MGKRMKEDGYVIVGRDGAQPKYVSLTLTEEEVNFLCEVLGCTIDELFGMEE